MTTKKCIKLITSTDTCYEYGHSYTKLVYVKASCKTEALTIVQNNVTYAEGKRIVSDYDCTGAMFADAIRLRDISWHKAKKLYQVKQRWNQDV